MNKFTINKQRQDWFKSLNAVEKIDYINNTLREIKDKSEVTKKCGFSWTWVSEQMKQDNCFYVATQKKFVIANQFTEQEIVYLKSLCKNKSSDRDNKKLTLEEAVDKKVSRDRKRYSNKSLYLDTEIFKEITTFSNKYEGVSKKEIITLALIELMERYNK